MSTIEQTQQERAQHAIVDMFTMSVFNEVDQWCADNQFTIRSLASEHVINLDRARISTPDLPDETPEQIMASKSSLASATRSAEHIFNVAMGIENPEEDLPRTSSKARSIKPRCNICLDLMRHSRAVGLKCAHQQLLLCPDCIIARCCDDISDETVTTYIVVRAMILSCPPILDLSGQWTFEYIQRIKFNRATLEGFIAFRTFVVYNVARICPPPIEHAPAPPEPPPARVFQLIRKATGNRLQRNERAEQKGAVVESPDHFVVRNKLRQGILLIKAKTFVDALNAIPRSVPCNVELIRDLEHAALTIFEQEPRLISRGTTFAPPAAPHDDTVAIFNYWRGWQFMPGGDINFGLVKPIIAFINEVWCANQLDSLCDNAQLILSWFAHIIQQPGAPPERQILFRGFSPELIMPLARFIGVSVIGAQYFEDALRPVPLQIAAVRNDCLFTIIEDCPQRDLKAVMRELHALWKKPAQDKTSFAERARKTHSGAPPPARVIDTQKIITPKPLLRAIVCTRSSDSLPIDRVRRRFGVVDKARAIDATADVRMHLLAEVLTHEGLAEHLFRFFAQFQPLRLFWD